MGSTDKIIPHYTYSDYIHWDGRWELMEGHPIAMSPLPVPEHQRLAAELRTELSLALRKIGCKECKAYDPVDYKISEDIILQPDILIVCGKINKNYLDFPPVSVVEILSPSTMLRDRNTKYHIYQEQGIKYYIIVDPEKKAIEIYQLIKERFELQPFKNKFGFTLDNNCEIVVNLENIWSE